MSWYFGQKRHFKVKNALIYFLYTSQFISRTEVLWIIVMFLSAVWTHSDGTHSLQEDPLVSKWSIYILDGLKVNKLLANPFWGQLFL